MKGKAVRLEEEKIIEVSAKLFGEKGFAATSIREISSKLNISVAALYYYFKSKEELLFTIIESVGKDLLKMLEEAKEASDDPLEQLKMMLSGQIGMVPKKRNRVKIFVQEQDKLLKKHQAIIYKQHRKIFDIYVEQLEKLRRSNLISFEPSFIAAFGVIGMMNWCYRWYKDSYSLGINDVSEKITTLFLFGVAGSERGSGQIGK